MIQINRLCRHPCSIKEMYPCLGSLSSAARARAASGVWPARVFGDPHPTTAGEYRSRDPKYWAISYKKEFAMSPNRQRSYSWRNRARDPALTTMLAVQCIIIFVSPFAAMGYKAHPVVPGSPICGMRMPSAAGARGHSVAANDRRLDSPAGPKSRGNCHRHADKQLKAPEKLETHPRFRFRSLPLYVDEPGTTG